ncbi:TetR/AcrR family transcriptional regulator [Streptomyces sp. NBC_00247]|uniref:TetR/AcrR family transcriptional regulator n=1 Tax=Streptomyces sp. NBC_00247 TaxID=2975689 RepID=UPI003FA70DBE
MAVVRRAWGHGLGDTDSSRPGEPATREAVLEAARRTFAGTGYDRTTMRGVAADAEVDASVVSHRFGSKKGLFAAAAALPFDPQAVLAELLDGPRETIGHRLASCASSGPPTAACGPPDSRCSRTPARRSWRAWSDPCYSSTSPGPWPSSSRARKAASAWAEAPSLPASVPPARPPPDGGT